MRVSMQRMLIGYGISVVLGMILGLGVASNKFLEETMGGLLVSLQILPSICWWPLALLWFGLNQNAILFVVVMGSLLSVTWRWRTAGNRCRRYYGHGRAQPRRQGIQALLVRLAASEFAFYRLTGLKQGWAFAWRSLITAEMFYLSLGLGQVLMMGRDLSDMNQVMAVMILIIILGYAVNGLIFRTMEQQVQQKYGLTPA